jgi:hypothetical protein
MIYKNIIAWMNSFDFDQDSKNLIDSDLRPKIRIPISDLGKGGKLCYVQSNKEEDMKWRPLLIDAYEEKDFYVPSDLGADFYRLITNKKDQA